MVEGGGASKHNQPSRNDTLPVGISPGVASRAVLRLIPGSHPTLEPHARHQQPSTCLHAAAKAHHQEQPCHLWYLAKERRPVDALCQPLKATARVDVEEAPQVPELLTALLLVMVCRVGDGTEVAVVASGELWMCGEDEGRGAL